jgi:DNA polymerase zeta
MTSNSPVLRVRVNHIDHILVEPGPLDNSSQPLVPIIRVYGISSIGKKTCVHVHQVYPYFYVEYAGQVNPESGTFPTNLNVNPGDQNAPYVRSGELYG